MSTLRVTAGALRGRRVPVPRGDLRPTSERARQGFFNIVQERIVGARFLDLFCGSGIFAIEAMSRGASAATAIDVSRTAIRQLNEVAAKLSLPIETVEADVLHGITKLRGRVYDLIYADPPYDFTSYLALLCAIDAQLALPSGALLAVEHRRNSEPFGEVPPRLQLFRQVHYGEVWISLFEYFGNDASEVNQTGKEVECN